MEKIATSEPAQAFLSEVLAVKESEAQAQEAVASAKAHAERLVSAAREKGVEINAKAQDLAVREKNRIIAQGRAENARMAQRISDDAKKRALRISATKLPESDARELSESIKL